MSCFNAQFCSYSSMMNYRLFFSKASTQYLDIELRMDAPKGSKMELVIPHWRPGRYEAGNFAKNVKSFRVSDALGQALNFRKSAMNRWEVDLLPGSKEVVVQYSYYAAELNAGSTWLDDRQLYVNPVNCLMYCPDYLHAEVSLHVELPNGYQIAGGLGGGSMLQNDSFCTHSFRLKNYDTLADSPFIASADLVHRSYQINGIDFHIWILGDCHPDWEKVTGDFFIFSNEILNMMGIYPHDEYHFLVQVLAAPFYHGVEHCNSTVIAIGPGHSFMKPSLYNEFLGVSCHELFHVWNVKHIRPADMLPYDFSGANYSRLGYVYEGLTTYYGDLLLFRSGIFGWTEWVQTFEEQLQKHFDNGGRFNYSVAASSFDTWLDGYVPGAPDRKVSIYTEGCLLAFMTDVLIRIHSGDHSSLDNVIRGLWEDFGKKGIGYTEADYRSFAEHYAGKPLEHLFDELINGTSSYEPLLRFCLAQVGLELQKRQSTKTCESAFGFRVIEGNEVLVSQIAAGSPAELGGLMLKDRIIAVNHFEVKNNLNDLMRQHTSGPVHILIARGGRIQTIQMTSVEQTFYSSYGIVKDRLAGEQERSRFFKWSGSKF